MYDDDGWISLTYDPHLVDEDRIRTELEARNYQSIQFVEPGQIDCQPEEEAYANALINRYSYVVLSKHYVEDLTKHNIPYIDGVDDEDDEIGTIRVRASYRRQVDEMMKIIDDAVQITIPFGMLCHQCKAKVTSR